MLLAILQILALGVMLGMVATPYNWTVDWRYWRFLPCPHPCCYPECDLCCNDEEETHGIYVWIPAGSPACAEPIDGDPGCAATCNPGGQNYYCTYVGTDGQCCWWRWYDPEAASCALDSVDVCLQADGTLQVDLGFNQTGAQDNWVQFYGEFVADEGPCADYRVADCDYDNGPYTLSYLDSNWIADEAYCRWRQPDDPDFTGNCDYVYVGKTPYDPGP